ncbi:hypothetical protein [Ancylomarina longa]|uniref:DUF4833 domain-containing protein n=1 Tax=Ancylomarina longa TaxID=2487017 RepID=A0A434AYH1_9BACT|nr:hypothetical protein [Ancylomarina longa]RUT79606.1 hypothetical protein DLK05_02635 [Ancylomarina longa]
MKTKLILIALVLFCVSTSMAQVKYQGTVNTRYKSMQLDNGEYKYVRYDGQNQIVSILNLDNTPWRTVHLPLPKNHSLDEIKQISQHVFNSNDSVEVVYSCVVQTIPENTEDPAIGYGEINFTLNIVSESGESILRVYDSNEMEIVPGDVRDKLLIYKHISRRFDNSDETLIYNLPIKKNKNE